MNNPRDYYVDEANHGSYQYISLKEIVNFFETEKLDDDSYIKNTKRTKIIRVAKDCIRDLNKNVLNQIKTFEITVPEELYIAMPHDYTSYSKIYTVKKNEKSNNYEKVPLTINENIHSSITYLQDHNHNILFDSEGQILIGDGYNVRNFHHKKNDYIPNDDIRKIAPHGEVIFDQKMGQIYFSSNLYDKPIVLEYYTDGLNYDTYKEDQIEIHKEMFEVIRNWIYFRLIEFKRFVPQSEKQRALNRFKTTRHEAKLIASKFNLDDIIRFIRTAKE